MDDEYVAAAVVVDERWTCRERKVVFQAITDRSNPFSRSERKFRKLFRLSREMGHNFVDVLCTGENNPLNLGTIPAHLKVLSALNFFAHGSYQTSVGEINILGQSQPTVSRSLEMVCSLILERLTQLWIKFPMTRQEKESTMQGFQDMYGIPHTLGAVDGTHISIHKPPINHPTAPGSLFYNRKGYYSINCQMICDAKSRITSVNPNFPGSTHDAAIWQSSNVHQYLKDQYVDHRPMEWLLGDKGYPLLPWLMTPLAEVGAGTPEERYNKMHSHARVVIEMTFGRLKTYFGA
ncbi:DDE superfamily endonuclease domain-containing protein [Phthorimaea operculella]|nr:DDE superfamily endonuclease domain-containing protein [Phthorimaea operculella]